MAELYGYKPTLQQETVDVKELKLSYYIGETRLYFFNYMYPLW